MIGNPIALLGLLAVAVPLLIHLLGRQRARVVRFPTLRFLAVSRLMPTRRTRLNDLTLLAVRAAVVIAAAIALAQPYFETDARTAARVKESGRVVSRFVIVDTSPSMRRSAPGGEPAVTIARREAERMVGEADIATAIETADPTGAIDGALGWLDGSPGRHELVVVSDFQIGVIDSARIADLPSGVGVKLIRIAVTPSGEIVRTTAGRRTASVSRVDGRSRVEWSAETARAVQPPTILAGRGERVLVEAALEAASSLESGPAARPRRPVAVIYNEYPERAGLVARARPIDEAWMGDAVARLNADPTLSAAAAEATADADTSQYGAAFSVALRNAAGLPVILASRGAGDSASRLDLWLLDDAGGIASAALLSAIFRGLGESVRPGEIDSEQLDARSLASWERPASVAGARPEGSESDGRWLWGAAVGLLALESWLRFQMRSRKTTSPDTAIDSARVGRAA